MEKAFNMGGGQDIPIVRDGGRDYPSDIQTITVRRRLFFYKAEISPYLAELLHDIQVSNDLLLRLSRHGVDLFSFLSRDFVEPGHSYDYRREDECISVLKIDSYDNWWNFKIGKKVRERIRGAQRKGIDVRSVKVDDEFITGVQNIYNETPIRQGRRYTGYGMSRAEVKAKFANLRRSEILGAYYLEKLIGVLWMVYGDRLASIQSFVSLIDYRDKGPNNALMAEAIKKCANRDIRFIEYGLMGYLPGLDSFKQHHGFEGTVTTRYFVPLSQRGLLAIRLKLHKNVEYLLPPRFARNILPVYNFVSLAVPSHVLARINA